MSTTCRCTYCHSVLPSARTLRIADLPWCSAWCYRQHQLRGVTSSGARTARAAGPASADRHHFAVPGE